jgi:amphi-Trp domain-containing protein
MSKKEISYKAKLNPTQAAALLENLMNSIKEGAVRVQVGEEHLLLKIDDQNRLDFEMSAVEKKGKRRLSLELAWKEKTQKDDKKKPIIIGNETLGGSKAPAIAPKSKPKAKSAPAAATKSKKAKPAKTKAPAKKVQAKKTAKPGKAK